jgi:hypothetical protein
MAREMIANKVSEMTKTFMAEPANLHSNLPMDHNAQSENAWEIGARTIAESGDVYSNVPMNLSSDSDSQPAEQRHRGFICNEQHRRGFICNFKVNSMIRGTMLKISITNQ